MKWKTVRAVVEVRVPENYCSEQEWTKAVEHTLEHAHFDIWHWLYGKAESNIKVKAFGRVFSYLRRKEGW